MARRKNITKSITIDAHTLLKLEALGFSIPALVNELLGKIAGSRTCPCCGREVRPMITGKKPTECVKSEDDLDLDF